MLLGGYYFIALLITYVVAETAHVRNLSPYVLMGAAACLARVCLAAALLGGHAIGSLPGACSARASTSCAIWWLSWP